MPELIVRFMGPGGRDSCRPPHRGGGSWRGFGGWLLWKNGSNFLLMMLPSPFPQNLGEDFVRDGSRRARVDVEIRLAYFLKRPHHAKDQPRCQHAGTGGEGYGRAEGHRGKRGIGGFETIRESPDSILLYGDFGICQNLTPRSAVGFWDCLLAELFIQRRDHSAT